MDQSGDIGLPQPGPGAAEPGATETEPQPLLEPEPALGLDIVRDAGDWAPFEPVEPAIERASAAVAAHARLAKLMPATVCIALSSDDAVRELNQTWRGKASPTNVLSCPAPVPPAGATATGPRFLGDVVLAAETIQREAQEMVLTPAHHLQHLVVHGLLHLLGFDHEREADAAAMETLETDILASIGVADPYAGGN